MKDREKTGPGRRALLRGALAAGVLLGLLGQGGAPALAAEETVMGAAERPRMVVPMGRAVGIKLFSDGVMVVGFSQIPAAEGNVVPARTCGLREGDVITVIEMDNPADDRTIGNLLGVQDVLRVISLPKF